jgi:triphosphoribosyl-dephospho-CoA synthase
MSADAVQPAAPLLAAGARATLACIWEATAAKPGNVYRGADFEDLSYADFLTSAAVIGPVIDRLPELGVGGAVQAGVAATKAAVATNSNLGILLLIAPLAACDAGQSLRCSIASVLAALTVDDTRRVYAAIRLANPGGLGKAAEADVNAPQPPADRLPAVMKLAAERDLVARQYADNFAEVFWTADRIASAAKRAPLGEAIVRGYLELLAAHPDTLIARKCGQEAAVLASARAAEVLGAAEQGEGAYTRAKADFDFWLRADGHRRNPGTSADIVAAALFVLLCERRLDWPVQFYN